MKKCSIGLILIIGLIVVSLCACSDTSGKEATEEVSSGNVENSHSDSVDPADIWQADLTGTYLKMDNHDEGFSTFYPEALDLMAKYYQNEVSLVDITDPDFLLHYEIRDENTGYIGEGDSIEQYKIDINRDTQRIRFIDSSGEVVHELDLNYNDLAQQWFLIEVGPDRIDPSWIYLFIKK